VSSADRETSRAENLLDEVEPLLRRGNKIDAIKVYRTATGTGLKEAKDTVDAIEAAMKARGAIEVDRAQSAGLLSQIGRAIARWRGQTG
jgi:ribosomal protein L7/L12